MAPVLLMRAAVEKKPPLKYFMLTMQKRQDNIRKTKTDKVDTFPIAKTLVMQDSYRFASL